MFLKQLSFAIITLGSISASAQSTINNAKLDSFFNALSINDRAMVSVAIAKNGTVLYSKTIGYTDREHNIKATTKNLYRIGSITKMFTATMIFQAIEAKKLSLTTSLSTYFSTVPNAGKINIGMMLGHRSGIHSFTDDENYLSYHQQAKTKAEMVAMISKTTPEFTPDSTSAYSNANYVLLGYILETIYNKPYKDILKENILQKAGLKETYAAEKFNAKNGEVLSYSYVSDWKQEDITDMSIPAGAGAIVSTPSDLIKFIDALFKYKLINKASVDQMKTIKDDHGMGMFTFPFHDKKFYGHNGGIDGFSSALGINPEDGVEMAYITNGTRYPMNDVAIALLSAVYGNNFSIPTFTNYKPNPADFDQYTGVYSSSTFPLKITISKADGSLTAQATGQSAFPLEPVAKDKFKFDQAHLTMDFNPAAKELTFSQGGRSFVMKKED